MKKIRILAIILAVLMLPVSLLVGCTKNDPSTGDESCNHSWKKEVVVQKTGCMTEGISTKECKKCGKIEVIKTNPFGHDFSNSEWVYNNDATCTADGTRSRLCVLRDTSETEVVPGTALGHDFVLYTMNEDGLTETATCRRCKNATNTRIVSVKIDFEGERNSLSYGVLDVYGAETNYEYKTETENETENSYLEIKREAGVVVGNTAYGVILAPRYDHLKAGKYVVEYDVKITEATGDLVLLSGMKENVTENFLTYDAAAKTVCSNLGPVYTLRDEDFGKFNTISVVLDDVNKLYSVYLNGYLAACSDTAGAVTSFVYDEVGYYPGFALENFKITMAAGTDASVFAVDNIEIYAGNSPKNATGNSLNAEYNVVTTLCGEKIVLKKVADGCTCNFGTEVVAPTCVLSGYTLSTCSVCGGQTISAETPATGHSLVNAETIEPTCIDDGYIPKKCACGYEDVEVIPALGHTITEDQEKLTVVDPTCVDKGYTEGPCARCEETIKVNYVPATGHTLNPEAEDYVKVDPTCEAGGYEQSTCLDCDELYKTNEKSALGHDMVSHYERQDAEVTVQVTQCSRCEAASTAPLSTEIPSAETMAKFVTINGSRTICTHSESVFEKKSYSTFETAQTVLAPAQLISGMQWVLRYGMATITDTPLIDGVAEDPYLLWEKKMSANNNQYADCYFEFNCGVGASIERKDVVLEFDIARNGTDSLLPLDITMQKNKEYSMNVFYMDADGNFFATFDEKEPDQKIGQIKDAGWTKVALVFHYSAPQTNYDIYLDGSVVVSNHPMSDPNKMICDTFYRFRGPSKVVSDGSCLFDDLYTYYGSTPAYVTGLDCSVAGHFIPETAEDYNVVAPNCTEKGYTEGTCSYCQQFVTANEVEATGHIVDETCEGYNVVPATCTTAGYTEGKCKTCEQSVQVEPVEALGHIAAEGATPVVVAPTCTEAGYTTVLCSRCNNDYSYDELNALDHDLDTVVITPATCEEKGSSKKVCKREGCVYESDSFETDALGHNYGEWVIDTEATCADGLKTKECERCHDVVEEVIPAVIATHTYGEEMTLPATTEAEGEIYQLCTVCGSKKSVRVLPMLPSGTQGVDYLLNDDETGYFVAGYNGTETAIEIANTYNGLPIVSIGPKAFQDSNIVSIVLPENVTKIEMFAFDGCASLTTVTINGELTDVEMNAFRDCDALATVNYFGGTEKLEAQSLLDCDDPKIYAIGNDKFFDAEWVFDVAE